MDTSSSGDNPCEIPEGFVKEPDTRELVEESDNPETLLDALGRCGLFSQETDQIPDILAFNDCVFDEKYYREKHGKAFPDEWYKIMAEVSKKKFEDMRNQAKAIEMISGNFEVNFSPENESDGGVEPPAKAQKISE